jgi:hypothetical protein
MIVNLSQENQLMAFQSRMVLPVVMNLEPMPFSDQTKI